MQEEKNKTFKIVTLGCRTNQYESQAYQDQLIALGYTQAGEDEAAEICIVNTCTVTESADSSSRHAIRQLARENQGTQLLVTGCFAERQPDVIKQIEGVAHVVPNSEKEHLLARIFPEADLPEFSITRFESHTRAFLKVQDGCNSFCTYCIIPYVRGRSRSRTVEEVIQEAKALLANGYKEIVLTGINIGDFDGGVAKEEEPVRLAELIRLVDQLPGLERLRVSSIDPDEVDDDLADAILNGKKTCHSMHIVLQSGSNVILKRMNRKYTRQIFFDTVDRLRSASPDFTFTTDIIVGFPGETDVDFADTIEVMQQVKFAKVHMFPYSDRPRTRSALMPNKVSPEVIRSRKQDVLRIAEQTAFELRELYVGRRMWVLTESMDDTRLGEISGHTENFLNVWVQSDALRSNQLVEVELVSNTPSGLIGRLISKPHPLKLVKENIA
ncbi:MiaB-like tRNA modifying enzyme [Candidatus Protochlamydia naegleriophila]|uniref:tRNA-2-methylthio-N(6)-dimethylallyladenosine synthase n=1 Tax=Candidatus Protochlamydia naegleriophila TaxID=389348 RepID=A0A0U5J9L8_9BACT|nr:tRNA (N(6)-L-threonylcarbamoyladenosine(37)-C(2))-methylthiotransferase MtaB [Candidatus Protochlamydia naegleriophila]CUI16488.1 MiaB-like tRNA modifying enzyme [Candidatus Protochlamydia naegleriophila]